MTREELMEHFPELPENAADWMLKTIQEEGLGARLSAAIQLAGGRSEPAILALLDRDALAEDPDPQAAANAVSRVKQEHGYLFEDPRPAGYSGGVGTGGNEGPAADAALRAAFGLE